MSAFNSVVDVALRALGPDLGAKAAARRTTSQQENAVHVPFILPIGFSDLCFRRYGFDIISEDKIPLTSDHPFMALDRAVIRDLFDRFVKPHSTYLPTLCIGVSDYEISSYYKNPAIEFFPHMSEGKDTARMALPILNDFLRRFHQYLGTNDNVKVKGRKARNVRLEIQGLSDLVRSYETARAEDFSQYRVHLSRPNKRYTQLLAHDCDYERTEAEWFDDFSHYEAQQAWVTGFYPDELLFPDLAPSTSYVYKRETRGLDPTKDFLVLSKEIAKFCLRMKFGPPITILTLVTRVFGAYKDGVPLDEVFDFCTTMIITMTSEGFDFFLGALKISALVHSAFVGILSDRASVTYRHGYSNGYEHPYETWSLLMRKPVLTSAAHDFVIEVELVQSAASHRLFRLTRSYATKPVVRMISPPKGLRAVSILNLQATFAGPVPKPVYFNVLESEFEHTINFLCGQMDQTLTFEAVQTLVNRAAGGVKIATTEVAPVWTMEESVRWDFAVTAALEAQRRHGRASEIKGKETTLLKGFEGKNWKWLLRELGKGFLVLSTAGLAVPVYLAFRWLMQEHSWLELVKRPNMESAQRWVASQDLALRLRASQRPELFSGDFEFNKSEAAKQCSCPTLELMQPFGKQKPKCLHKPGEHKKTVTISVTKEELDELKAKVFTQRETAAPELQKVLDKFKDAIPVVGFEMELELDLIIGGPGVGKSRTARTILTNIERKSGCKTFVYAPFNKLAPDYPTEPRDGNVGFSFRTTHRLIHERGVHTVLGDEFTCLEEMATLVSLYNCNATRFIATGDNRQTGVRPEEGQRFFFEGSKFRLSDFTSHILPVQFRSSPYEVALANEDYDCGMYADNDVIVRPTVRDISDMPTQPNGCITMAFTKDTARQHGQEENENTVRSNQGSTIPHVQIPVHTRDLNLVKNDPLFLVAFTRHTKTLTFYCEPGECTTTIRSKLRLDDEEFQKNIMKLARPNLDDLYGTTAVVDNYAELNALANELVKDGTLTSDEVTSQEAAEKKTAKTVEELLNKVSEKYAIKDICSECGGFQDAVLGDVCMCRDETQVDIARNDELVQTAIDVDFSGDGWCLPFSATQDVRESRSSLKHRRKTEGREVGEKVVRAPFVTDFLDYKVFARANGHQEGKGLPTDVFVKFLEMKEMQYIVEVTADNSDDIVEFYRSKIISEDKPLALVTVTCNHASGMTWERARKFLDYQTFSFSMPNHSQLPTTGRFRGCDTLRDVGELYPSLKLTRRGHFEQHWPILVNRKFDPFGFVTKALVGKKPVWAERFIRPFLVENNLQSIGPRTTALDLTRHRAPISVAVETESQDVPRIAANDRLFGTDGYAMGGYLDATVHASQRANHDIVDLSITENIACKLRVNQLIGATNARGNFILSNQPPTDFAIAAGFGLVQHNNAVETLACTQRYIKQRPIHRFSPEGARLARSMATKNLIENYDLKQVVADQALEDAIVAGWESDASVRQYGHRVECDFAAGNPECMVTFSTKAQEKVSKKPYVDPEKIGQGISAVSSSTNYEYGALFRVLNYRTSRFSLPSNIYDCGMSPTSLKTDVREQRNGKVFDTCTVVDVVQCDALQNWFTVEGEVELRRSMANEAWMPQILKYYRDVRGRYKMTTPGLFSAQVEGPKPSGAPDTLEGNGNTTENYATSALKISGPSLKVKKGDDRTIWSTTSSLNHKFIKEAALFTDFSVTVSYGSAQFTGKVITPDGMFDDVIKKARKALMHRVRNYKQWAEFQESLRDAVKEILEEGLVPTVASTAYEYGCTYDEAYAYFQVLWSLSHIDYDQWTSVTKDRTFSVPNPPSAKKLPFSESMIVRRFASYDDFLYAAPVRSNKTWTRREQRKRQKAKVDSRL